VSIDKAFVDWSGNCGNLSAAVGPFAISNGLVDSRSHSAGRHRRPVRIWQANIGKTIVAHVPVSNGAVQETGDFELDGVTFPAAEIVLEFIDPAAGRRRWAARCFPPALVDDLDVPGVGTLKATMINAGIPTIFVNAADIGYNGTELQDAINGDARALAMFETIRAHGALRMGLIRHIDEAAKRQHTPKVAFVARPPITSPPAASASRPGHRPAGAGAVHGQAASRHDGHGGGGHRHGGGDSRARW
jgi:2-methylaconitate isomerase